MNTESVLTPLNLLAVSFAYPPLAYPRSIQVARLLKRVSASSTVLVCADEAKARKDPSLEPDAEAGLKACLRIPFRRSRFKSAMAVAARQLSIPVIGKNPDPYRAWNGLAARTIERFLREAGFAPDVLVTFGQPMSVHLLGLELKRRHHFPWVAHFSDPWSDNPLNALDPLSRALNRRWERRVLSAADRAVFTSQETADLVLRKYPDSWREKAVVLPHAFDPRLFDAPLERRNGEITIRYLGSFYRNRTLEPLFRAISRLLCDNPSSFIGVRFEIVGALPKRAAWLRKIEEFPSGLIRLEAPVSYRESLLLMASSDGLLIIDAPADRSVFLPSKLMDYIGAGRPILGLTPEGASANVIKGLGGWVADPGNVSAMADVLKSFLEMLRRRSSETIGVWGDHDFRQRYEAGAVAARFNSILQEVRSS
jgi:glycosyltransferase involved in cell wall biosynthesis